MPATLSLTLGTPAAFGAFTPGVTQGLQRVDDRERHLHRGRRDAHASPTRAATATGHLVNGTFSLPSALQAKATSPAGDGSAFAPVGGGDRRC